MLVHGCPPSFVSTDLGSLAELAQAAPSEPCHPDDQFGYLPTTSGASRVGAVLGTIELAGDQLTKNKPR
jgi:hypothetical protein